MILYLLFFFILCLILTFIIWKVLLRRTKKEHSAFTLHRYGNNPVVSPSPFDGYDAIATFNPAVIQDNDGTIHMMYRAIGTDGVSRLGYASSSDGFFFEHRLSYPIFSIDNAPWHPHQKSGYNPSVYPSGGSSCGIEDPRLVAIGDRVYLIFNAFAGWDFIRVAVSSIKRSDFVSGKWDWTLPFLISPKGQIHKNWVLFPEKIHGKFAVLHSLTPRIQIDYVDRLEDLASGKEVIQSEFSQKKNSEDWDTWVRGAGPPPIKTDKGWLVLYHATTKEEPHRYKLGALLLDIDNPRNVLARSSGPILLPDMWYENDAKPGVIYACGAVIRGDKLLVYYGGGDKYCCVAETQLKDLLLWLKK